MKRMMQVASCATLALAAVALAAPALTMQDIQALAKQRDWRELLDNAHRVDPGNRTPAWNGLVRTAALDVVTQIAKAGTSHWRAAQALAGLVPSLEQRYAFLTTDKPYVQAKAEVIARAVEACETTGAYGCGTVFEVLADGITKFPAGTARSIALRISEERSPAEAIHFWALAVDDDAKLCRDGRLERATIGVLRSEQPGPLLADALHAADRCYAALETSIASELDASDEKAKPRPAFLRNVCGLVTRRGKRTVLARRKCP